MVDMSCNYYSNKITSIKKKKKTYVLFIKKKKKNLMYRLSIYTLIRFELPMNLINRKKKLQFSFP